MTDAKHIKFRQLTANNVTHRDLLAWAGYNGEGVACVVERREEPMLALLGKAVALSASGGAGRVQSYYRYGVEGGSRVREWSTNADQSLVLREIERLARHGLWELNDFIPADRGTYLGGTNWVVRAIDTSRNYEIDAFLCAPWLSINPHMRRLFRLFVRLMRLDQAYFARPLPWWRGGRGGGPRREPAPGAESPGVVPSD